MKANSLRQHSVLVEYTQFVACYFNICALSTAKRYFYNSYLLCEIKQHIIIIILTSFVFFSCFSLVPPSTKRIQTCTYTYITSYYVYTIKQSTLALRVPIYRHEKIFLYEKLLFLFFVPYHMDYNMQNKVALYFSFEIP